MLRVRRTHAPARDRDVSGGRRAVAREGRARAEASAAPKWLGVTHAGALELGSSCRVIVRPSGTAPKLKIYVDLPGQAGGPDVRRALQARAGELADAVVAELGFG